MNLIEYLPLMIALALILAFLFGTWLFDQECVYGSLEPRHMGEDWGNEQSLGGGQFGVLGVGLKHGVFQLGEDGLLRRCGSLRFWRRVSALRMAQEMLRAYRDGRSDGLISADFTENPEFKSGGEDCDGAQKTNK